MFAPVYDENGKCTGFAPVSDDWKEDCMREHSIVLTGKHAHWCPDWDYLTMDETCPEWPCQCTFEIDEK